MFPLTMLLTGSIEHRKDCCCQIRAQHNSKPTKTQNGRFEPTVSKAGSIAAEIAGVAALMIENKIAGE